MKMICCRELHKWFVDMFPTVTTFQTNIENNEFISDGMRALLLAEIKRVYNAFLNVWRYRPISTEFSFIDSFNFKLQELEQKLLAGIAVNSMIDGENPELKDFTSVYTSENETKRNDTPFQGSPDSPMDIMNEQEHTDYNSFTVSKFHLVQRLQKMNGAFIGKRFAGDFYSMFYDIIPHCDGERGGDVYA